MVIALGKMYRHKYIVVHYIFLPVCLPWQDNHDTEDNIAIYDILVEYIAFLKEYLPYSLLETVHLAWWNHSVMQQLSYVLSVVTVFFSHSLTYCCFTPHLAVS